MRSFLKSFTAIVFVSTTCLTVLPSRASSQTTIVELGVENNLDVDFDVVLTYSDNVDESVTVIAGSEVVFTAPSGKSILAIKVGGKTVDLPMIPSIQDGWNIPNTLPGGIVVASSYKRFDGIFIDPEQGIMMSFSYDGQ